MVTVVKLLKRGVQMIDQMTKPKKGTGHALAAKYKNIFKRKGVFFLFLALGLGFLGLTACSSDDKELKAKFSFQVTDFTVQFTNESENATRYEWDFGDFTTSIDENPEKTYPSSGTFMVTLTASDDSGNSDEASQNVEVINTTLIGAFSCAVPDSDTTGFMVTCTNTSTLGDSEEGMTYSWNFGDSSTPSTDRAPTHTYTREGNYTIILTVTAADDPSKTRTPTQEIAIVDFSQFSMRLAGSTSAGKKWILRREGVALGIWPNTPDHPSLDNIRTGAAAWWSFGGMDPLHSRPCILDDEYTFAVDGDTMSFVANTMGTFFRDLSMFGGHQGNDANAGDAACVNESTNDIWKITREPISGETFPDSNNDMTPDVRDYRNKSGETNKGGYTFTLSGAQLTIDGAGSYIGLQAKSNAGDKGYLVPAMRSFRILKLTDTDNTSPDELVISMPINNGGGGYWVFSLLHYENESDTPAIPTPPCPDTMVAAQTLPIDFQGTTPGFEGFLGVGGQCDRNPKTTGNNDSSQAGRISDPGSGDGGAFFDLMTPAGFSTKCGLDMDVYGRAGLTVRVRLEIVENNMGTQPVEVSQTIGAADTWQTLSFDFSGTVTAANNMSYNRLVFLAGSDSETTEETLYIDNIKVTADTNIGACGAGG